MSAVLVLAAAVLIRACSDPRVAILIGQLDNYLERIKGYIKSQHEDEDGTWELDFHVYGQHQVSKLPETEGQPGEVFIIGEALASSQALATRVACLARIAATVRRPPHSNLMY